MGLGSKGWIDLVPRLLHHFPAERVERASIRGGQMVRRVLRASAAAEAAATFSTTVTINATSDPAAAFVAGGTSSQPRVSMSEVTARFATLPADASQFDPEAIRHPVLTRTFPAIDFNPTSDIQV